ncbi:MAG: radical SAM protein [Chloroflexi bacterium]|nr:radical SAM protein [Chloroflexota bacterium]
MGDRLNQVGEASDRAQGGALRPRRQVADTVFYELTRSLCPVCKRLIDAQIHLKQSRVIMRKRCPDHGWFEALISSDAEAYVNSLKYNKPGDIPLAFSTEVKDGCPYDCGLCPEHKQHACLALIEVNTGCNLACPTCFANAGPGYNLTLEEVERMLDEFVRTEGDPEVVQFSGGEPTLHPQLFDVIQMAKDKGIRHIMVNTNGLRIARDPQWAQRLAELRPMVYFQFDGLEDETYVRLRGEPLLKEKMEVLDRLAELDLDTILVATVERGVNEHEVGALVKFGLEHPAVRGVNFQPVTHTGRHEPFDPMDRVTIPEVIERIQAQTDGVFVKSDFVPVPCCHPGCQSVTYAYVEDGEVTPLPRIVNVDEYLDYITNRSWPDPSQDIKRALEALWSSSAAPGSDTLADQFVCATCNIDLAVSGRDLAKHIFAVSIKDFMDAYTFDVKKVMKCCVEIITPDGKLVPFCAYNNVGYRERVKSAMMKDRLELRRSRVAPERGVKK